MKYFDHERLDVYSAAIDFVVLADDVVEQRPRGRGYLADQLQRAATSIALNIAEGAGEFSGPEKARFYRIAKRSATQCAAVLDVVRRLERIRDNGSEVPNAATGDAGYWNPHVESDAAELGTEVYVATERRRQWQADDAVAKGPPPEGAAPRARMRHKLRTEDGRAIYARRKGTVEPVFGQAKEARGFRRFHLRGLVGAAGQWSLLCTGHNLLKRFRFRRAIAIAA